MAYQPTQEDFDAWDKDESGFSPTEQHFDEWDKEAEQQQQPQKPGIDIEKLKAKHPIVYGLAERLAKHPKLDSAVKGVADSPVTEAGISGGTALQNAFRNMINLPSEVTTGEKTVPNMERPFPEPEDLTGQIGSTIGSILGAGTGFAAVPGSMSLPGGLATGFAQGEGGVVNRSIDAMIGMLLPGALHAGKFGKKFVEARRQVKKLGSLEKEKVSADRDVFSAKEKLADKLNSELEPVKQENKLLANSIEQHVGDSESYAKTGVATALKQAKKAITDKYTKLYEGFNSSKAGQSPVKEPLQIESLEKEYGLKPDDFSPDTRKLIDKMIGKENSIPESEMISVITGKPTNQASIAFEQAKTPKVEDYVNLWKQVRAEVSDLKHSASRATTPESARTYRNKANQLEKFSDSVNEKAMGSLDKADAAAYSKIQHGYATEKAPFMEKDLLRAATGKSPVVSDKFFDKLNKEGVGELVNYFKQNHPELVDAITRHDVRGLTKLPVGELKDLLKGDFGRFISKDAKDALSSLAQYKEAEDLLGKALGKVQSSEIGRKVRASDINDIIKRKPELGQHFDNVAKEQKRLRDIKNALKDEGFKMEEIKKQLQKYKSAGSAAKTALLPVGAYLGLTKSKGNSRDMDDNN
jgi:hypothetical protein